MRVALLGFGTVGQAVARLLIAQHADRLTLTHVFNRGVERKRVDGFDSVVWTESFDEVLAAEPDVVVELLGGVDAPLDYVRRAIEAGCSVVTANKQIIARHGPNLMALANANGVSLRFEGSVAGGVPVLRAIEDGLSADRLVRVAGVVNGTSTYILSQMEEGRTFAEGRRPPHDVSERQAVARDDLDCEQLRRLRIVTGDLAAVGVEDDEAPERDRGADGGAPASVTHATARRVRTRTWPPNLPPWRSKRIEGTFGMI